MGHGTRTTLGRVALAAAITAAVAFAGAGCGGDDEPDPVEAARAAADEFVGAIGSGDFEAACGALTDELASQLGGDACSEQIGAIAGEGGDVSIEVTNVRVSGPKAVAETEVRRAGAEAQESSFELVESEGSWKVSGLGD
ncbi:MAG TPA: hypothetical protein VFY99_09510 [Solirubrobacterales bacterium]